MMSDMLSQEEIDALLRGSSSDEEPEDSFPNNDTNFNEEEKDAIGEIGNISMGTAATTLSTLLGNRVNITTPKVSVVSIQELSQDYPMPFVAVDVRYKEGIKGTNLLVLKEDDTKIITDLMMGGIGTVSPEPLSELHLSAIGEAMNQMVGSASTSLSEMFAKKIDIHPPRAFALDLGATDFGKHFPDINEIYVKISFRMEIGDLIDSEIMQLIPLDFAKEMVDTLLYGGGSQAHDEIDFFDTSNDMSDSYGVNQQPTYVDNTPKQEEYPSYSQRQQAPPTPQPQKVQPINVQPAQFQSFDTPSVKGLPENIALIQDVPLKVTVELGRTVKKISEILEFGPGTIIELDKVVGEPLDILVNGQYVAKGEVVVIDENYGIRITDIVNPAKRLSKF